MDLPLSAISIGSLSSSASAVEIIISSTERDIYPLSAFTINTSLGFLSTIADLHISQNGVSFLTDILNLSSYFNLSSLYFNVYHHDNSDFEKNVNVDILSSYPIDSQFLLTAPIVEPLTFTIIPLKNSMLSTSEYAVDHTVRTYDGLYVKPTSHDVFLQYQSNVISRKINPDQVRDLYIPTDISSFPISSLRVSEHGGYGGSCPANSDNIFIDKFGYSGYTDSGYPMNIRNGELLCIWLSGNMLMERWYDPNLITQGDAYLAHYNTNIFNNIIDVSSDVVLSEKNKFQYSRMGPARNEAYINSLSSNLVCLFDNWNASFSDEISNMGGFIVGDYKGSSSSLELDGSQYAVISPDESLYHSTGFTTCMWVRSNDWSIGKNNQLWGNYKNYEGCGLFYNTGAMDARIILPCTNGKLYNFNTKGFKTQEKNLLTTLNLSSVLIDRMATDATGARWMWDSAHNSLYKFSPDASVLDYSIALPENTNIFNLEINSQNDLYILDSTTNTISAFDQFANGISSTSLPNGTNNFTIDCDDQIRFLYGKNGTSDRENNIYKTIGKNIYKNNQVWFHMSEQIKQILLDSENKVYVLYGKNRLTLLSNTSEQLWDLEIPLYAFDDNTCMSFVREKFNGVLQDMLWVIFNNEKHLVKINTSGLIVKRITLSGSMGITGCNGYTLTPVGDFTGYEVQRKFNDATLFNPHFSLRLNLSCGSTSRTAQLNTSAVKYQQGWVHLAYTVETDASNSTTILLYVNGIVQNSITYNIPYTVQHRDRLNSFLIGYNDDNDHFQGQIDDIRLYSIVLDQDSIRAIANHKHVNNWKPLILSLPCHTRSYLEKVEKVHLNKYPGLKSNKFNIRITGIDDTTLQEGIVRYIQSNISRIKPAHTILNSVLFD